MKIENMQINAFGNIKNKQIELDNGINIIQGNNESGKSTLLKFIVDMFYGISKNKRGKEFSDYDKYKPWDSDEFSGKISYKLDNGEKFEVFRDFNKKNPKIYNELSEDISNNYTIDKTNGNIFFKEQTKIDEETFLSTFVSCQTEVKLEKQEQNILLQKIANMVGTGDDNTSYKKAMEKINKKQIEEIGTLRTTGRPINLIKEEQFKLQDEIGELEEFKQRQYELEERKNKLALEIEENEIKLETLKKIGKIYKEEELKREKIILQENVIKDNDETIKNLRNQKENLEVKLNNISIPNDKKENKKKQNIILLLITIIAATISILLRNNIYIMVGMIAIATISLIMYTVLKIKTNKKINNKQKNISQDQKTLQNDIEKIVAQIQILEDSNKEKETEIKNAKEELNIEISNKIENILNIHNIEETYNKDNIMPKIDEIESKIKESKLNIHSLDLDKENIIPKLEKLSSMEERLEYINEKENELLEENESIELAKEVLEIAYKKMKENITPKFTQNLSKNMEKISNSKYKNIRINDEEGIIVEKENGEYVSSEKLSIGTIEQLYLSLRFGAIQELTDEKLPIILDEAFAYYDETRLSNILKYINDQYKESQIIILTCTDREKRVLENEKIKYNMINM